MNPISIILIAITSLFILFLTLQRITGKKVCAICASVSTTWIGLLIAFWFGYFPHPVLIGVLMGQSAIGIYYLLEKKCAERWHLYRLPFLLTETFIIYLALGQANGLMTILGVLGILWIIFVAVDLGKQNKTMQKIATHIVACCKNW